MGQFLRIYDRELLLLPIALAVVAYPLIAWCILRTRQDGPRKRAFACFNVASAGLLVFLSAAHDVRNYRGYVVVFFLFFLIYVVCVLFSYMSLRRACDNEQYWTIVAVVFPILVLIVIKYLPAHWTTMRLPPRLGFKFLPEYFVGISYLTFRIVHLAQEVRNEVVGMPDVWQYLSFAFFVPTLAIGPISPYSKFAKSLKEPDREVTPLGRSALRILIGAVKYFYFGSLIGKFTYGSLLRDGHPHSYWDLLICVIAFPLFLYCNFSGYCDMAIGASGLLCIEVEENFDRPFLSRDFQAFWTRWHITLSKWLRDMLFTPISKALIRHFGPRYTTHILAGTIVFVFVIIGIWHGDGMNFALFGLSQGVGLAVVHYYTTFLRARLGKQGYQKYLQNRLIHYAAIALTFTYFSLTLVLFANSMSEIRQVISALR